jgi:hypothetical protein
MIRTLRQLLGLKSEAELQRVRERAAEHAAWERKCREGRARYEAMYDRLENEPADLSILPEEIKETLAFLFADNNFQMTLTVGGARGVNADLYFTWRSGSVRTLFEEKDYGTETFIRMVKAAYKVRDILHARRQESLRRLLEEPLNF